MTEAELQLSLIYTGAFKNRMEWTAEDHLAGIKAVFAAGAAAGGKSAIAKAVRRIETDLNMLGTDESDWLYDMPERVRVAAGVAEGIATSQGSCVEDANT